jgi:hypothetical protein
MTRFVVAKVLCFVAAVVIGIDAHGRFIKPVSRSSIWRVPEFASQNPPANYDDNQLYCGGIHQADDPGSNCGHCGDPFSQAQPRDNEVGGKYYKGIIVGTYQSGQVIDISVDLTTSHMGNMEWRLCPDHNAESQACFNQHVLELATGGTKYAAGPTGILNTQVRLPQGVRCEHCVLQWNYRAGELSTHLNLGVLREFDTIKMH